MRRRTFQKTGRDENQRAEGREEKRLDGGKRGVRKKPCLELAKTTQGHGKI